MISAFDHVGFQPTVKAGHADGQEDEKQARKVFGAPALGYVKRLYRQGQKLLADIIKVPRRFADLVRAGNYSRVSAEIYWSYSNHDGKKFPRVLKSVAFLGADIPSITSLKEIEALYQRNDAGGLYAYDDAKNEYRLYEAAVVDRAPTLNRYKEEGTFKIEEEDGGYCVYNPRGEKVKTWPTLDEAKVSLEGYNYMVVGEAGSGDDEDKEDYAAQGDVHLYYVRKRGDKWVVVSKEGKVLGEHATEAEANAQLRAVEANKYHLPGEHGQQSHGGDGGKIGKLFEEESAVWVTADEMKELCPACAGRMDHANLKAVKVGYYAAGVFNFAINLPENTKNALCDKFGDNGGFRTRCMASSVAKNVDDPGAFCNALKQSCFGSSQGARSYAMDIMEKDGQYCVQYDDGGERCFPSKEEADAHVASMKKKMMSKDQKAKGGSMPDEKELDLRIKDAVDKALAEQAKVYEQKADARAQAAAKAAEAEKAEVEKANEKLRADFSKLQAERKTEKITGWIDKMKAEGKLAPVEEERVRAMYEWLPDGGEEIKYFSVKDGKSQEHAALPVELLKSLFEQRPSAFKVESKHSESNLTVGDPLPKASDEADRRAKAYQEKHQEKDYVVALRHVLNEDPVLKQRFNEGRQ